MGISDGILGGKITMNERTKKKIVIKLIKTSIISFFVGGLFMAGIILAMEKIEIAHKDSLPIEDTIPDGYQVTFTQYFVHEGEKIDEVSQDILWQYPGMRNVSLRRMTNIITKANDKISINELYAGEILNIPVYVKQE